MLRLPAEPPEGLSGPIRGWLLSAWAAGPPMCCDWRIARGFALCADPQALVLLTGDEHWPDLRRACGFRWYRGVADIACARFAGQGWLRRLDAHAWCLAWPDAVAEPNRDAFARRA